MPARPIKRGEYTYWNRPTLERFKLVYAKHKDMDPAYTFNFEGNEFVSAYAKYLIEYLETQLPKE